MILNEYDAGGTEKGLHREGTESVLEHADAEALAAYVVSFSVLGNPDTFRM